MFRWVVCYIPNHVRFINSHLYLKDGNLQGPPPISFLLSILDSFFPLQEEKPRSFLASEGLMQHLFLQISESFYCRWLGKQILYGPHPWLIPVIHKVCSIHFTLIVILMKSYLRHLFFFFKEVQLFCFESPHPPPMVYISLSKLFWYFCLLRALITSTARRASFQKTKQNCPLSWEHSWDRILTFLK